jgi:tetraacyldisaccharide 4'-kinase
MKLLLIPISYVFRFFVFIRNLLYKTGILKAKILEPKIISVGNISAGGTGKTPFVEILARKLLEKGKKVVIIMKGYKREFDDIKVVEIGFKNEKHELNTENLGDEALMLLENLDTVTSGKGLLVVGDDKTKSAKFAATKFKPEIMIIDDGFQHRKLYRDLDIVILNKTTHGHMFPAGKLREPLKNFKRADLLVMNNKFETNVINENRKNKPHIICIYEFEKFLNIRSEIFPPDEKRNAIVFCGIGEPGSFRKLLNDLGINVKGFITYPDHHNFSNKNINEIIHKYKDTGSDCILTTQKDFVRIKNSELVLKSKSENPYKNILYNYPLFYAKIKMQINKNSEILDNELNRLLGNE